MNTKTLCLSALLISSLAAFAQDSTTKKSVPAVPATKLIPAAKAQGTPEAPVKLIAVDSAAPDFISNDIAGKPVKLSDYKGKVVVLDFWATWCGPCIKSLPHTESVAKEFKPQGVVILAVCTSDTRAKYEPWVKENQEKYADVNFTCEIHERGSATFAERASKKLYGVSGIPTRFVINRDGKIVAALVGFDSEDARLEAGLARAGIKVDNAVAAKGEQQLSKKSE